MSNSIISTAPPAPPTPAQQLQRRAKILANQHAQAFQQVQQALEQTANFIWRTPANAQAAFNAFTAAGFKASDLLIERRHGSAKCPAGFKSKPIPPMEGRNPAFDGNPVERDEMCWEREMSCRTPANRMGASGAAAPLLATAGHLV